MKNSAIPFIFEGRNAPKVWWTFIKPLFPNPPKKNPQVLLSVTCYRFEPRRLMMQSKQCCRTALDSYPVDIIRKFVNRSRRFMDAYRIPLSGKAAAWAVRKQKGHPTAPWCTCMPFSTQLRYLKMLAEKFGRSERLVGKTLDVHFSLRRTRIKNQNAKKLIGCRDIKLVDFACPRL